MQWKLCGLYVFENSFVWSKPLGIFHGMELSTATKGEKKSVALLTYVMDKRGGLSLRCWDKLKN